MSHLPSTLDEIDFNKKFPTFCILPWIHLSTRPNGHMRVCCTANASSAGATQDKLHGGEVGIIKQDNGAPANLNNTSLSDAWNNSYMKNIRLDMLNGKIPASCTKCFKEEASGHNSKRQWETAFWSKRIDKEELISKTNSDGSIPPFISYIDLRLGTKCNLKCIMCSPHDSSLWVSDWHELYPNIENETLKDTMQWPLSGKVDGASYNWHLNNESFWQELYQQIPNLHQLYFAGGEPLIIEHHYLLLEKCIEMGYAHKIQLRYNSNGIELPQKLFDLWAHFKSVRFHFSLDSVYEMNDYIRYPSQWDLIEKNLDLLDQTADNVEITLACAVQMLNMYYIPDLIKWKLKKRYKKINIWPLGAGLVNYHFVYHPPHLNVKVFPKHFKSKIEKKYEELYQWLEENIDEYSNGKFSKQDFLDASYGIKRLKGMVNFMNSEDWSVRMPEFQEYINQIDKIRKTSFYKVFPDMRELLE
jgi:MoaA/NifB/PqqE/SkfB family radical SAM enzyme